MLLFIFGVLFLKNLLPNLADHNRDNHDEIGHIHFFHGHNKTINQFDDYLGETANRQQTDDDENCSSGKSIFADSHVPSKIYKIVHPSLVMAFELVFNLKNNFKTPYLEPQKKPPRLA